MGLISGLLGLLGCDNKKADNQSKIDSSKVEMINPNDILFTTPTLENALPDFENSSDTTNLHFHEDDWRQIEFVSKDQKKIIDKEIAKIKDIFDNFAHKGDTYTAFKKVAVRELITQPLTLDLTEIKSYLADKNLLVKGLSLDNNEGQVRNGFSFTANGVEYYGQFDNNKNVKWFCIYSADNYKSLKSSIPSLSRLLKDKSLYLIDWREMKTLDENSIKTDFVTDDK